LAVAHSKKFRTTDLILKTVSRLTGIGNEIIEAQKKNAFASQEH
jgi:hypothetical protein